jgi:hypothetical protein
MTRDLAMISIDEGPVINQKKPAVREKEAAQLRSENQTTRQSRTKAIGSSRSFDCT